MTSHSNPTPAQCLALLPKLGDGDADLRYMSLNDLTNILNAGSPSFINNDYHTCAKIIDGLLKTLDDKNGEVQNQAIKCVGALVLKLPVDILAPFIHKVSSIQLTNSVDNSVPTTALRTFITAFPPPLSGVPTNEKTNDAYAAISKVLIPRLLGYLIFPTNMENLPPPPPGMLEIGSAKGVNGDAVDVLVEVIRCFGPMLRELEKQALQRDTMLIIDDERSGSVVKKKAVVAISLLCHHMSDTHLRTFVSQIIERFRDPKIMTGKQRLLLSLLGSISRSIPQKIDPFTKSLVPFILSPLSQEEYENTLADMDEEERNLEIDEVREAALQALEGFLACCSNAMRPFTNDAIAAAVRYVSYDPNTASDEDDEAMDGLQEDDADDLNDEDEDFEQEGAFSDDEDSSWKIRRCAAKALFALISTRSNGDLLDDGTLYERVAPVLVKRFKEREENVRLEMLLALSLLVRRTGESSSIAILPILNGDAAPDIRRSKKRRRLDSNTDTLEAAGAFATTLGLSSPATSPSPVTGPRAELGRLSGNIVKGVAQIMKQPSMSAKQAAVALLRDIVIVQSGGLSETLDKIMEPLLDVVKNPASSMSSATTVVGIGSTAGGNLRLDALQLLGAICDTHSSKILAKYIERIVSSTIDASKDKYYKVVGEALLTLECITKAITPPRSAGTDTQRKTYITDIFGLVYGKAASVEADLEVRQKALHALGVLLARTPGASNAKFLPATKRSQALQVLQDRLNNETTRLASVKAIEMVAVSSKEKNDIQPEWARSVSLELGAQFRKADRNLRSSSLAALRALVGNKTVLSKLDDKTMQQIAKMLLPLVNAQDLSLLQASTVVLTKLVQASPKAIIEKNLINALCNASRSSLGGNAFESFLGLVQAIGESGEGQTLMNAFLQDVGVGGDPDVVGKSVGTLLVAGGNTVGVGLSDFETELRTNTDPQRKCLALSVIGEVGFRLQAASPLEPKIFTVHFESPSDTVQRAAATALGRAGASNSTKFLPVILEFTEKPGKLQYLSLYAVKEILQNSGSSRSNITPYSKKIWDNLHAASKEDDNKILGAECIGRITAIEPTTFLPRLQEYLKDPNFRVRSTAIQAVRFTFTDCDDSFDDVLRPVLVYMLSVMLADPKVENRRLALGAFNAAIQHKADIVLPHLSKLLTHVLKDSKIDPDLIHQVMMGPFKVPVDDGLELRKSAYETLFSVMEIAYPRLNHDELFERIISGLEDEHEIKMLCILMVHKLAVLDPVETARRLDSLAEKFRVILNTKPKDNAVKQDYEKINEASKNVLKVTIKLHDAFPSASAGTTNVQSQSWKTYWDWLGKEHKDTITKMEGELKSQA